MILTPVELMLIPFFVRGGENLLGVEEPFNVRQEVLLRGGGWGER